MPVLSTELRNHLARVMVAAREAAEAGARSALQALAVHHHEPYCSMTPEQRVLRNRLRAHGRQLGDQRDPRRGTQDIDRITHECAYQHWHRMLFARFLAENNLLVEPDSDVAITMTECEGLAREQGEDPWAMASRFAQRMLPQIFRVDEPVLEVTLPPETRQTLERLLAELPSVVFTADDSLGWTYQFWQSAEKERVNNRVKSGEKITGRTIPAVTQLFTEHYMVLFLLHNTIGAWHAGKVLADRPGLADTATSEQELREAVALDGYSFNHLRFVREPVGDDDSEATGPWRPAAGTFDAWPRQAKDLKVLDPCCGSGHFLVAAFDLLVRLRMVEEGLSLEEAVRAVLAENLFGLELDARCTQIAAFNLALAAWKMVGRVIDLPALNIACSGLSVGVPKSEWLKLAGDDIRLRNGMDRLYDLFEQAPELGSLIDPRRVLGGGDLFSAEFHELQPLLEQALKREDVAKSDEQREIGVAAQGIARAAALLTGRYHWVITNVPYLARGKQSEKLKEFCETHYSEAKHDLATVFLDRCLGYCYEGGTASIVLPQNWLFLTSYKKFREKLLKSDTWHLVARLGPGAFETVTGEVVKAILLSISRGQKGKSTGLSEKLISGIDASEPRQPAEKAELLRNGEIRQVEQAKQLKNPDVRVVLEDRTNAKLLEHYADSYWGLGSGDYPRFGRCFWERTLPHRDWIFQLSTVLNTIAYGAREHILYWQEGKGDLVNNPGAFIRGTQIWGLKGVHVSQMRELPVTLYTGECWDTNSAPIIPKNPAHLLAIWCFCSSPEYHEAVRRIDQKLNVTNATLVKVPFDLEYWQEVAAEKYPNGLPKPYSDDPTQWIFHGHPAKSEHPLQVAVGRLLGYRWPAELDAEMELSDEAREWVKKCNDLLPYADQDGIVCLSPLRGEEPGADRLRRLLAAAFGSEWSLAQERQLLQAASGADLPAATLEEWLQDKFFEEHCRLFHHRPFVWHIWDGRRDGFNALVNYHRLAGPEGEGRRTLEALTYTYLGDWIERQKAEQREGKEGADARLAAALDLHEQLQKILEGEPPYDIFVRWKPLYRQPIGWEPDINDGVRLNIRPFMSVTLRKGGRAGAGVLRWKPNINWKKDRGKEPQSLRPQADYPWFWSCDPERRVEHRTNFLGGQKFDGNRWNDLHYSNAVKQAARERAAKEGKL
ncbi:MAG: Eco57I restriction-modification methylase domain-containing protein [Bacillota bacterium]